MSKQWSWLTIGMVLLAGCGVETESERKQVASQIVSETISASDLYRAYKENEVAADERFAGKLIIVTGVVDSVGKDISDRPYVDLRTERLGFLPPLYLSSVQCEFAATNVGQLSQLRPGQKVKIWGSVDWYSQLVWTVFVRGYALEP